MCGIAGILTANDALDLRPALRSMMAALRHRGPDGEGTQVIDVRPGLRVGLVHTRLSIQDLSEAGRQPMHDPASGSWIVFNGEIYNHWELRREERLEGFHSTSDTETLLRTWCRDGESTLGRLRGMFAAGVYDAGRHEFWLVRDRLGIKPLYAARVDADTWIFASEVRAILASGLVERRIDPRAVASYLAWGAVSAPWTICAGIESLLPGETWRWDLSSAARWAEPRRTRYWRPRFAERSVHRTREEAIEQVRDVLPRAVQLRMLSDVPVGVFLSGGIDSSALVAVLSSQGYTPHTYSVRFAEKTYDESVIARQVAQRFGTQHHSLLLESSEVLRSFDVAVAAYDQPSIDGLNTYFLSRCLRQAGLKVALSGLGGDELFAGYPGFRNFARSENRWFRTLMAAAHAAGRWARPGSVRCRKLAVLADPHASRLQRYAALREVASAQQRQELLSDASLAQLPPLPERIAEELARECQDLDPVNAYSLCDLSLYMSDMLLRDADQMSMAHALEVRVPLLDHELVERVAGIPGGIKLVRGRSGMQKPLLLDSLPAELPAAVWRRRKMGFVFPWEQWLRQPLRRRVAEILDNPEGWQVAGVNPTSVGCLWEAFLAGRPGVRSADILGLVNLIAWVQRNLAGERWVVGQNCTGAMN